MANPAQLERPTVEEIYFLNADGTPKQVRSRQILKALGTVSSVPYAWVNDSSVKDVKVTGGGTAGDIHEVGEGILGVDIRFDTPLQAGDVADLDYTTTFNPGIVAPPNFRYRAKADKAIRRLMLSVVFDIDNYPSEENLWQAEWPTIDGSPTNSVAAVLEPYDEHGQIVGMMTRMQVRPPVDDMTYGFHWELPVRGE